MVLSIVTVNYKVRDKLKNCLSSIYSRPPKFDFEVIVVDNETGDGAVEMVRRGFPPATLIVNQDNIGFARGVNQGAAQAKGEYILLLNPDTVVRPGSLEKIVQFARSRPQAGVIGGRLVNFDGTPQSSVRAFPTLAAMLMVVLKLQYLLPQAKALKKYYQVDLDYSNEQDIDQVMGAYFLVPAAVWRELKGLDENFFIYFEEVDFCRRAKNAGYKVLYTPQGDVEHALGASFGQQLSVWKQRRFDTSLKYYFKKHNQWAAYYLVALVHPLAMLLAHLAGAWLKLRPKPRLTAGQKT